MNINDLLIFKAVAQTGSFTKAASLNNTVQSNISARIKYLENYFQVTLFHRTSRKMEITESGQMLLKAAKEILTTLQTVKAEIAPHAAAIDESIKIGCMHTTAALRLPEILNDFTGEYPTTDVHIKSGTSSMLIKEVLSYRLDGAFVSGDFNLSDLDSIDLRLEEMSIISSGLIKSLEDIKKSAGTVKLVVFDSGCYYRKIFENTLATLAIPYKIIEIDTLEGIINSVEKGIGITLLPEALVREHFKYRNLKTFPLPEENRFIMTKFIKRKDFPMSNGYFFFYQKLLDLSF